MSAGGQSRGTGSPAGHKGDARPLLDVRGLKKHFPAGGGLFPSSREPVRAVDGIDIRIERGETLALVGESGSGKTTTGRCILRLIEPTSGSIMFDGVDLLSLPAGEMRRMRRRIQIVFQDPDSSLDPRMKIGAIVGEPLAIHRIGTRGERKRRVVGLLEQVGLDPGVAERYPHEFSGGQRQRVGLARALAVNPELIVCDEPVSALDVSVRAQVINLLDSLKTGRGLTYLLIAHDLSLVEVIADRVAVMHQGRIVETARTVDLFRNPRHPYTRALLESVPVPDPESRPPAGGGR